MCPVNHGAFSSQENDGRRVFVGGGVCGGGKSIFQLSSLCEKIINTHAGALLETAKLKNNLNSTPGEGGSPSLWDAQSILSSCAYIYS